MISIGCHLSVTDGYLNMGKKMKSFGGDTFAFFTRNPRGGKSKILDKDDAKSLNDFLKENGFNKLVAHASYTMNLCSANEITRKNGCDMLKKDLALMEHFPNNFYNFHPGSHTGLGVEKAVELISSALNDAMTDDMNTTVLLETMAGKGSEVGKTFEELKEIIDRVEFKDRIGVCFDTCHVFDGGYDIVNGLDSVLTHFDKTIGLERLYAVHLNDSKNDLGSHKDRHEKIGLGKIGTEALKRVVNHPALKNRPFILETPNDDTGYIKEIKMIKEWIV